MNNRNFQQQQNQMRRNQQAADQSRRTRENMQRQQTMVQHGRENSQGLQHGATLSRSEIKALNDKSASRSGCGVRLSRMFRGAVAGAIGFAIFALFSTHGGESSKAADFIFQLTMIGASVGFCFGCMV